MTESRCSRCLKLTDGVHTCKPTPLAARLESDRQLLLEAADRVLSNPTTLADEDHAFPAEIVDQVRRPM